MLPHYLDLIVYWISNFDLDAEKYSFSKILAHLWKSLLHLLNIENVFLQLKTLEP